MKHRMVKRERETKGRKEGRKEGKRIKEERWFHQTC
jgi:hypothetical protein